MAKLEIDARLLEPEGESPVTENFNRIMKFIDNGGTGDGAEKTQVGELILGTEDITVVQTA